MKVWVAISVLCLVWSTSFDLSTWKTLLLRYKSTLPYITPKNNQICWLFNLSQTCSDDAISTLLGLPAAVDTTNWVPTLTQCDALLDAQRAYVEVVVNELFPHSIASAKIAGVTNFELMLQIWAVWDGYEYLAKEESALVAAIESITDWTTVTCIGDTLLHDGVIFQNAEYLGGPDCEIMSTLVPAGAFGCAARRCNPSLYQPCCDLDCASPCCLDTQAFTNTC